MYDDCKARVITPLNRVTDRFDKDVVKMLTELFTPRRTIYSIRGNRSQIRN